MAFKEWEIIPSTSNRGHLMLGNQFSVICRDATKQQASCYVLTINSYLSEVAYRRGFERISISQDDITGEIALLLRKEGGLKMRMKGHTDTKCCNLVISCKPLVERLSLELKLAHNQRHQLSLSENKSKRDDVMFFLINH